MVRKLTHLKNLVVSWSSLHEFEIVMDAFYTKVPWSSLHEFEIVMDAFYTKEFTASIKKSERDLKVTFSVLFLG